MGVTGERNETGRGGREYAQLKRRGKKNRSEDGNRNNIKLSTDVVWAVNEGMTRLGPGTGPNLADMFAQLNTLPTPPPPLSANHYLAPGLYPTLPATVVPTSSFLLFFYFFFFFFFF
jgi:hypothetical protein